MLRAEGGAQEDSNTYAISVMDLNIEFNGNLPLIDSWAFKVFVGGQFYLSACHYPRGVLPASRLIREKHASQGELTIEMRAPPRRRRSIRNGSAFRYRTQARQTTRSISVPIFDHMLDDRKKIRLSRFQRGAMATAQLSALDGESVTPPPAAISFLAPSSPLLKWFE